MNRKQMIAYLESHLRYNTLNSWNNATSYAANVKIHRFVPRELLNTACQLLDIESVQADIDHELQCFAEQHRFEYQIGFNGRSGGYLVLYKGGREPSGYKSYCTWCGQLNYRTIAESNNLCGQCKETARMDFKTTHYRTFILPGQSIDKPGDVCFDDWNEDELKTRIELVKEFDKTVAACKEIFLNYCRDYRVEEEEIRVMTPKKVKTLKRREEPL